MQIEGSIRKHRDLIGYKQEYMAGKLNLTQQAYQKIEAGKTNLTIDMAEKIAAILHITVADIYISNEIDSTPLANRERELYEMLLKEKDTVIQEKEEKTILLKTIAKLATAKGKDVVKIIEAIHLPPTILNPKPDNKK